MIECNEFKMNRDGIFIDNERLDRFVTGIRYDCKLDFDVVVVICYVMNPINEDAVLVVKSEPVTEELRYFWKRQ